MLNQRKPLIFTIHKIKKNGDQFMSLNGRNTLSNNNLKRLPWIKEEDEAIISLVEKFGTKNWTLVASKLSEMFQSNSRTGKQCRERWHNHLDFSIKKEYWTEKEEAILFTKHMEYGNKWSDIAKFLPGRTDNSIKNHFYSKLRKFIRKILKALHQENAFQQKGIDSGYYNSDRIYKIIKKNNIPYNVLSKGIILDLILLNDQSHAEHPKILSIKKHNRRKLRKIGFFSLSKIKRRKMLGDLEKNNRQIGQNARMKHKTKKERYSYAKENFNKENINDFNLNTHNDIRFGNRLDGNKTGKNDYNYQPNANYLPNLAYNPPLQNNLMSNNTYNSIEKNIQESMIKTLSQNLYANNPLSPQNSPIAPEFTMKLLQELSKLSNVARSTFNNENNQNRNSLNYFNFSEDGQASIPHNDYFTFNNRFFPEINYDNNMSTFTLGNNSSMNNTINDNIMKQSCINDIDNQSFVNNSNWYNFPQVKQGDINISNLMIGACGVKNNLSNNVIINNSLMGSNSNLNKSHHELNENLKNPSYSLESDCIFQDRNGFNMNNMANLPNMNQAFSQFKSFNCVDDLLNDDSNYSSNLNKQTSLAKVNTNINNSINMNVSNYFPSYSRNLIDNYNLDLQTYLNMRNSTQPFNCNYSNISGIASNVANNSYPITPNMTSRQNTQIISPNKPQAVNGLSISPKSAFVKNFEINVDVFKQQ